MTGTEKSLHFLGGYLALGINSDDVLFNLSQQVNQKLQKQLMKQLRTMRNTHACVSKEEQQKRVVTFISTEVEGKL